MKEAWLSWQADDESHFLQYLKPELFSSSGFVNTSHNSVLNTVSVVLFQIYLIFKARFLLLNLTGIARVLKHSLILFRNHL